MSEKRDRPAHFNNVDQDENDDKIISQRTQENQKDNDKDIGERKIKDTAKDNQGAQTQPKFTLFSKQDDNVRKNDPPKNQDPVEIAKDQIKVNDAEKFTGSQENGKKDEEKKNSLFPESNIFGNGIGIFTNNGSTGLFSGGIFAKSSTPAQATQPGLSQSLFGNSQSIFNFSGAGVPPIKKDSQGALGIGSSVAQGEEDDGDSAELEKDQNVEIDKSKSTGNYEYTSNCSVLFQQKATKIKKNNGQTVEGIDVVVSQDSEKLNSWITVRLSATKNSIVTGLIIKGKTEAKHFGKKDENVVISLLVLEGKKQEKQIIKVQFENGETGKKLVETIQGLAK